MQRQQPEARRQLERRPKRMLVSMLNQAKVVEKGESALKQPLASIPLRHIEGMNMLSKDLRHAVKDIMKTDSVRECRLIPTSQDIQEQAYLSPALQITTRPPAGFTQYQENEGKEANTVQKSPI